MRRLVRLLASTSEYKHFGGLWRDSGGDLDETGPPASGGSAYVGPAAGAPFDPADADDLSLTSDRRAARRVAGLEKEWAAFAALAEAHGADGDPVRADREAGLWAPRRAVRAARDFHQTHVPHVPFEIIRAFLHKTNAVRETRVCVFLLARSPV